MSQLIYKMYRFKISISKIVNSSHIDVYIHISVVKDQKSFHNYCKISPKTNDFGCSHVSDLSFVRFWAFLALFAE